MERPVLPTLSVEDSIRAPKCEYLYCLHMMFLTLTFRYMLSISICSFWIHLNLLFSYNLITQVSGFKKVLNYMKRVAEEQRYKRSLSREEVNQCYSPFLLACVDFAASLIHRNYKIKLDISVLLCFVVMVLIYDTQLWLSDSIHNEVNAIFL